MRPRKVKIRKGNGLMPSRPFCNKVKYSRKAKHKGDARSGSI